MRVNHTQQWLQRSLQAAPPGLKGWLGAHLPGLKQWVGDRAFNQIDRAALQQFAQTHAQAALIPRSLAGGLAVVVPCYNHGSYLEATFTSLFRQSFRPFHIVCVDDCSTDGTSAHLQQFAAQLPSGVRMTLLQTPKNEGQAAAINLGIGSTDAAVYTILNDDDYLMHDALEAIWTILHHRPNLALLGSGAQSFAGAGCPAGSDVARPIAAISPRYSDIPLQEYSPPAVLQFTDPNQLNMTHSGTTFYRSVWQAVGGYYTDKSQRVVVFADRDFQLRAAALFPVAIAAETPLVYWRDGSSVDSGVYS